MKKKLTLDIEELRVESFDANAEPLRKGTVLGRDAITESYCDTEVASGCDTNDACCYSESVGDRCGTSAVCDDFSHCWGGNC